MSDVLAMPEPALLPAARRGGARDARLRLDLVGPGDAARGELEAFIAAAFLRNHGARVSHFCDMLVGCRNGDGALVAALGYSLAGSGAFFLEQYLDGSLEQEIAARTGRPVERDEIVEVGNLAATHPGAARTLIVRTTRLLHDMGLRLVAFTATPTLLNSFGRLQLQPQVLAPADPSRLPGGGREWGSYYDTQPQVMFGDIRYGYAELARHTS